MKKCLRNINKLLIVIVFAFYQNLTGFGAQNIKSDRVKEWVKESDQLGFQENKGQILDVNHLPVPNVLFKVETPGLNIWVTTTGLTYQFFRIEEEDIE